MLRPLGTSPQVAIPTKGATIIMHPIELMRKREWTYLRLASEFGVCEAEARRWAFRKESKSYRNPPAMALILAAKIDQELEKTA